MTDMARVGWCAFHHLPERTCQCDVGVPLAGEELHAAFHNLDYDDLMAALTGQRGGRAPEPEAEVIEEAPALAQAPAPDAVRVPVPPKSKKTAVNHANAYWPPNRSIRRPDGTYVVRGK